MADHIQIQCGPHALTVPVPDGVSTTQFSDILTKVLSLVTNPQFLELVATIMALFQKTPTPSQTPTPTP